MKANVYLLLYLLLAVHTVQAQMPQLTYSHSLPSNSPNTVSQDRSGHVYVLDKRHNLLRLDTLGQPLDIFSPPVRGRITSIDAWNPMKVQLFYRDRQEILLLDRFMRPISSSTLSELNYKGIAKAASLAADEDVWLFDETSLTLTKLDTRLRQPAIETPLNLILDKAHFDVQYIREYQNMVYLLDFNSGIFVFDNLGNYIRTLPFKGLRHIGFRNNTLYFVQDNALHFVDLYTLQENVLPLPEGKNYVSGLVTGSRAFLYASGTTDVYILE